MEDSGLLTKRQKSVIASLLQRNLLRRNEFGELDKQLEGFIEFPSNFKHFLLMNRCK